MGDGNFTDLMIHDGLWCAFHNKHMAVHGGKVAREYSITREEQDQWALRSHQLAINAQEKGLLAEEILPAAIPQKKGEPLQVSEETMTSNINMYVDCANNWRLKIKHPAEPFCEMQLNRYVIGFPVIIISLSQLSRYTGNM